MYIGKRLLTPEERESIPRFEPVRIRRSKVPVDFMPRMRRGSGGSYAVRCGKYRRVGMAVDVYDRRRVILELLRAGSLGGGLQEEFDAGNPVIFKQIAVLTPRQMCRLRHIGEARAVAQFRWCGTVLDAGEQ